MSSPYRPLARVALATVRRTTPYVSARYESSSTPYPFTKPADSAPRKLPSADQSSKAAYPFTQPSGPKPVTAPTRPTVHSGPTGESSEVISREASEVQERHGGPDYGVAPDYRTSAFSPVPTRIMDGSELGDITAAAVISGAPTELQARTVRIYQPAKTATQSGDWHKHHWQMDWDILHKGHRWENPLMGWASSADFMQGTKLNFKSKQDAIRFAEKQGYEYFVQEPNERAFAPKQYASQFLHSPKKLKQIRTK